MGPNNKLFRELNQPFESLEALNTAIGAFIKDFEELRKKHRMLNVVMMVQCPVTVDDEETMMGTDACFGDQGQWEAMAARMLGAIQSDRQKTIARMLAIGITKRGER